MTEPLAVWREKLAGVTPLDLADCRELAEILVPLGGNQGEAGRKINRLTDALERSDPLSRILADEATVEALAEELWAARYGRMAVAMWTGGEHDAARAMARACLNHLAQLALGDGR